MMNFVGSLSAAGQSQTHIGNIYNFDGTTPGDSNLLGDLYVTDPSNDLQSIKRTKGKRVGGTCEWILTTPELANWINSPAESVEATSGLLWLHGNPGQGKSTMAIYITEALTRLFNLDTGKSLSYFFCDSSYETRSNANFVLRGLLWHFYTSCPELIPDFAKQRYSQLKGKLFSEFDSLWTLLLETARANASRQFYCIVDALDECDDESREDLLLQLEQNFETSDGPSNIHFLLLSRPYVHIRDHLGQFENLDLASLPQLKEDVKQYIDYELEKLTKKRRYSKALKEKVKTILIEKAEDTFLWVGITCRELQPIHSVDVLQFLNRLPTNLEAIYSRIFDSLVSPGVSGATDTQKILSFVATAVRPLSLLELSEACSFDPGEDDETKTQYLRDRVERCSLLVHLVSVKERHILDDRPYWADDPIPEVQLESERVVLLHQSVKDYIFHSRREQLNGGEQHSHAITTYRCLDEIINGMPKRGLAGHGNFLRYSICYWPHHARLAKSRFRVRSRHASFFSDPSPVRDEWLFQRDECHVGNGWRSPEHKLPLLNVAALWSIPSLVDYVSERSSQGVLFHIKLDDKCKLGCSLKSPLTDAIEGGCLQTFRKLLQLGLPLTERAIESAWTQRRETIQRTILKVRRHEIVKHLKLQKAAAAYFDARDMLVLMDYPDFTISESLLQAAMGNRKHWSEMLDILLPKSGLDPKVLLQQTITRASIASVKFLIDQFSLDLTAEPTLVAKAAENLEFGPQIIDLLLQRFHDINVTDDVILAIINHGESGASGVSYVCDSLKVLFDRLGPDFQVTNRVLLGAARAEVEDDFDGQVFKVVFQRASVELEITQEVVMAAAQNSNAWDIMQLLLNSRPAEICMTEEILCATIPKLEGSYSYLLRNAAKHSIKITEKTIAAAARDSDTGREAFLQVLNAADANTRITQDVLLAAATNYDVNGTQIMWLLLRESMNVDEVGTEVLEKVLQGDKSGIMSVILKRRGATIRLTKDLVQGWISNERTSGKALKFLLQYKAAELHSILDAMSTDEQAEFMDRWDQLFKQFEQDSWESVFKKHGK